MRASCRMPDAARRYYGERLAVRYLHDAGPDVLDRNWRCARGEIDIVARRRRCLVVCEVKTRAPEVRRSPSRR